MSCSRRKTSDSVHPEEDFETIQSAILAKGDDGRVADDNLFVDKKFPPDESSLTYVYSGDDKYEKMVFVRPKELCVSPNLYGVGGICDIHLSWKQWNDRHWFLHALAIVSLNPRWMERLIPGHKKFEQGFCRGYTGLFRFRLWRFGSWIEQLVDDNLPVLDGRLAYCQPLGTPPEFWGPLVEKAYAKCHKAYEAIEAGNPLNALTDLTGAICQRFDVRETAIPDDYNIVYKSSLNRSLVVCWRRSRSLKDADFQRNRKSTTASNVLWDFKLASDTGNGVETHNSLYLITAAAKFPMRDGSMQEMLRVKDPYNKNGLWQGEFGQTHDVSWSTVNPTFMDTYRPRVCTEQGEFWISYLDFCKHFAAVVICSSHEPYKVIETGSERKYKADLSEDFTNLGCLSQRVGLEPESNNSKWAFSGRDFLGIPPEANSDKRGSVEILVQESEDTTKVDNSHVGKNKYKVKDSHDHHDSSDVLFIRRSKSARESKRSSAYTSHDSKHQTYNARYLKSRTSWVRGEETGSNIPAVKTPSSGPSICSSSSRESSNSLQSSIHSRQSSHNMPSDQTSSRSSQSFLGISSGLGRKSSTASSISAVSNFSENSDTESTYSTSDIKIKVKDRERDRDHKRSKGVRMPRSPRIARYSLPGTSAPLINSSQTSIFESRVDYFRPRGEWKDVLAHKGRWTRETSGGARHNLCNHSRNPRVSFTINTSKTDSGGGNEAPFVGNQGKSHVIISLVQDYRQGTRIGTGLLSTIGFCIYRSKHPDRDEKRNISKLPLVTDVTSENESREVTSRIDLEPGSYIVVPYTMQEGQMGEFLIRILAERDETGGKNACCIS